MNIISKIKQYFRSLIMWLCNSLGEFRGKRAIARFLGLKMTDKRNADVVMQYKNDLYIKLNLLTPEHQSLYYFRSFDDHAINYLRNLLDNEGCVFLDIGASVGIYTIAVADIVKNNRGRIKAVEPYPTNFEYLQESIALNNLEFVDLYRLALGESDGCIKLNLSSRAPVGNVIGEQCNGDSISEPDVAPMYSLDKHESLLNLDRLDCIKIDIEGFDLLALKGMSNIIKRYKPVIYAELSVTHMNRLGIGDEELSSWMNSVGYSAYQFNNDGSLEGRLLDISDRTGDVVMKPSE